MHNMHMQCWEKQLAIAKYQQIWKVKFLGVRVESRSDDPDNLGHLIGSLFGGSSGSHSQN